MTRILLIHPPIYDFTAYDFWLKPYGLLSIGGWLRQNSELSLFDFLDRSHPSLSSKSKSNAWGCGKFASEEVEKPEVLKNIERRFKRFGIARAEFQEFLKNQAPFDAALIGSSMTYWYLGVKEVIEDIRELCPNTRIVLGGTYATLCPLHAANLEADMVIGAKDLDRLFGALSINPSYDEPAFWEGYGALDAAVMRLTTGCPFSCTYCFVPQVWPKFEVRPKEIILKEYQHLLSLGVKNIAFYDDALLAECGSALESFLLDPLVKPGEVSFHTPNALHARFVNENIAHLMAEYGFKKIFLGFELVRKSWRQSTGDKVRIEELRRAVKLLTQAGIGEGDITAYILFGHPLSESADVETSMREANAMGLRIMLSEFSPVPGTPDGEMCRKYVDLDEPLWHNKTVFPMMFFGENEVRRLKETCRELNQSLTHAHNEAFQEESLLTE